MGTAREGSETEKIFNPLVYIVRSLDKLIWYCGADGKIGNFKSDILEYITEAEDILKKLKEKING